MKNQFLGQDGFVWWKGVVESRQDPLKLGRCKVRIFGWHKDGIDDQPTESLPWATPLLPLDAGKNTIGPKEGDWVLGFFMDAENAQNPMMMHIIPGMNESKAPALDERIGHQDLRPDDILKGHQQPYPPDFENTLQSQDGTGTTITEYSIKSRYPDDKLLREPDTSRFARGFSYGVVLKVSGLGLGLDTAVKKLKETVKKSAAEPLNKLLDEKTNKLKEPKLILPRAINKEERKKTVEAGIELGSVVFQNLEGDITTPEGRDAILRSGGYTAAGTVLWEQDGSIFLVDIFGEFTKGKVFLENGSDMTVSEVIPQPMGHLYRTILRPKILNALEQKYVPIGEHLDAEGEFAVFDRNVGAVWSEPLPPYRTQYPYNHVYESESGHLLEFDDTPGFERIHLIHRSGTFEEIHPNGLKVEKVVNDSYRYYLKHEYKHTEGKQFHTIDKGVRILGNTDGDNDAHYCICIGPNSNFNVTTLGGQVNFHVDKEFQIFANGDVNVDCENAKIHSRGDTVIHTEGNADWHVEGDMALRVDGSFYQTIGMEKDTIVGGNYIKTVAEDYNSTVGGRIDETSDGDNSTTSGGSIFETSSSSNYTTAGSSIYDVALSYTLISATSTYINGTTTEVAIKSTELAVLRSEITVSKTNTSVLIVDAALAITSNGFITSNGIIHGSTYV